MPCTTFAAQIVSIWGKLGSPLNGTQIVRNSCATNVYHYVCPELTLVPLVDVVVGEAVVGTNG